MDRIGEQIERQRQLGRLRSKKYRKRKRLQAVGEVSPNREVSLIKLGNELNSNDDSSSRDDLVNGSGFGTNAGFEDDADSGGDAVSGCDTRSSGDATFGGYAGYDDDSDCGADPGSGDGAGSGDGSSMNVGYQMNITPNCSGNDCHEFYFEDNDNEDDIREASMDEDEFDDVSEAEEFDGIEALRDWALSGNPMLPHTRVESLLAILRRGWIPELPKCAKTFLGTSKFIYNVQKFNEKLGSEFVYFGIAESLRSSINPELHKNNLIELIINIDGMQLFRSSDKQFWPILCKIFHDQDIYKPFPIAIYSGNKKPDNVQKFLEDFIAEMNILHENGIKVGDRVLQVCIKAFVCDTPARALMKCAKGHGGYWSCERCDIRGIREEGRTVYLDLDAEPRTDESYREQRNPEHHKGTSPLLDIEPPVNMISSFLLDFMHLCCLGVMKKLLAFWLYSPLVLRLSQNSKNVLTTLLIRLQRQIPVEFQRTTRSLSEIDKFKAVEYRFLLLYAGPVIFKQVLSEAVYKHFLLLHTACRILCSKELAVKYCEHAKYLLRKFVEAAAGLYGRLFMIGNVHNLVHLADDVQHMGCHLSMVTAFPFENALGKIKKLLRSGRRPLSQICRRLGEIFLVEVKKPNLPAKLQILRQLQPDISGKIPIKRLQYKGAILTLKSPDNTVLLANGTILEITDMYLPPNKDKIDIVITGTTLRITKALFTYPVDSNILKMWNVTRNNSVQMTCKLIKVEQKMVLLDISELGREKMFTMPVLHM